MGLGAQESRTLPASPWYLEELRDFALTETGPGCTDIVPLWSPALCAGKQTRGVWGFQPKRLPRTQSASAAAAERTSEVFLSAPWDRTGEVRGSGGLGEQGRWRTPRHFPGRGLGGPVEGQAVLGRSLRALGEAPLPYQVSEDQMEAAGVGVAAAWAQLQWAEAVRGPLGGAVPADIA